MKIFLRPIEEKDSPSIVRWRNDPEVLSHCLDKTRITEESNREFFKNNVLTGKYKQFIVECLDEVTGVCTYPIATVYLKDMDYGNKRCELCIFTSSDVEWNPEGQTIAIEMLTKKAFEEYGMHKVYSYVFAKYPDEIELLKNAGYIIEAKLKEESMNADGHFDDLIRMAVFNNE
jgi:RimJ/RimL family protein N-acetyltransferase